MRKHHKRTVCQGEKPRMKRSLCHWWQRGRDLLDAEDRGMVPGGADLSDAEDRGMVPGESDLSDVEDKGMVPGGAWVTWFQHYIRVISLVQKGRYYLEEDQRHSDRGSSPKRRMSLCHWCPRGRNKHWCDWCLLMGRDWCGEIVTLTIDV